jgi:hypothetical protein
VKIICDFDTQTGKRWRGGRFWRLEMKGFGERKERAEVYCSVRFLTEKGHATVATFTSKVKCFAFMRLEELVSISSSQIMLMIVEV